MRQVNIYEAKTQLSKLIARVQGGEEVVIARSGRPVARLVPYDRTPVERVGGGLKGLVDLAGDWDSSETNQALIDLFEGSPLLPAGR